jgi:dihydropteroate synthase
LIAQIINLTNTKIFEKYRAKYRLSWDNYFHGMLGLEIRRIDDNYFGELKTKLNNVSSSAFFNEMAGDNSRILLTGNTKLFHSLMEKFVSDKIVFDLLERAINNFENYDSLSYIIKDKEFNFNSPYVMGILNVTPDSFSDGGKYLNPEIAAEHGIEMIDEGADFIDIGGESSRPGAEPISAQEEISRIIPVIQNILLERPNAIISIDTNKNLVATEALQFGASIINDISGLSHDQKILETVKKFNASLVIMHMLGNPKTMQKNPEYENVVEEVYDFIRCQCDLAAASDVRNIFIDPGIGFGKTVQHNMELIQRLEDFKSLGYPILIGVSRKSFLGKLLDTDIDERDVPTSIVESLSIKNGARIIRTHNVKYGVQVCKLLSSLI